MVNSQKFSTLMPQIEIEGLLMKHSILQVKNKAVLPAYIKPTPKIC